MTRVPLPVLAAALAGAVAVTAVLAWVALTRWERALDEVSGPTADGDVIGALRAISPDGEW